MSNQKLRIITACIVLAGCQTSLRIDTDTGADTEQDVVDEEATVDLPADPDVPDAPDGSDVDAPDAFDIPDTPDSPDAPDVPDGFDAPDVPDTSDPPSDPPTEIGAPCSSSEECEDGLFCNGDEYCHPTMVCRRTPPPDCNDGIVCTADSCDETGDTCSSIVDPTACVDGNACTQDLCDMSSGGCAHPPVDCHDSHLCTLDACTPGTGACTHTASNVPCEDGNACTVDTCNTVSDTCSNVLIDGDSDGYPPSSCGGTDCNDANTSIHPGATDTCGDGIDQDCNGTDGVAGSCACPVELGVPDTYDGTTSGAASLYSGSCNSTSTATEIVHRFVLTGSSTISISVSSPTPTIYPTVFLRQGSCSGVELGCATYTDPTIDLTLGAGTYYLFVEGWSSSYAGPYSIDLHASFTPTPVTGNDTCATSYLVTAEGTFTGSNTLMTDTTVGTCGTAGGRDVWFRFTLGAARHVTLDSSGSSYDTVLYVRQTSCTGTQIQCDDDSGTGTTSMLSLDLAAGTYYVVLDAYSASYTGNYSLTITGLP